MKTVASVVLNNFINDSRVLKEAISLANNNYKVVVIALHDDKLPIIEKINNILVRRIVLFSRSFWSRNKFIQIFKYIQFLYKSVSIIKNKDIVHCNDLKALPVGVLAKLLFNKKLKVVYDAHEYETQMFGMSKAEKFFSIIFEKILINHVDALLTVSNSIAKEYKRLYPFVKPKLVYNTPYFTNFNRDEDQKNNIFRNKFNIGENQKIFIYQGGLSKGRGIETILVTFQHIHSNNYNNDNMPVIIFMGYGVLSKLIKDYSKFCSNIFYHKAVKVDEVLSHTRSADFGINFIENSCLSYYYCMPNKLFEYLMADLPVITSNLKDVRIFVEENNIGEVSQTNDVYGLFLAIKKILNKDKSHYIDNISSVKEKYNWEKQEVKLLETYKNL